MTFKTILGVIGIDHDNADTISVASLADRSGAHLGAIVVACVPPPPFSEMAGEAYEAWSQMWEDENSRLERRVGELRQLLKDKGLPGDLQPVYCIQGDVAQQVGERACYADVTVVGGDMLKDEFLLKRVLDGAIFNAPTPTILVPKGKEIDFAPKRVLVAWNAGVEAGRALRQSIDLLAGAEDVRVVVVDPQATSYAMGQEPGADIAAFLTRHGVKTTVDVLASGGHEVDEVLRQHAVDTNADLIVMGAYGHSRLRERIFGGTTASMIESPTIPVLFAH
jgi:nucleotide-binding universal stress UspA family protein